MTGIPIIRSLNLYEKAFRRLLKCAYTTSGYGSAMPMYNLSNSFPLNSGHTELSVGYPTGLEPARSLIPQNARGSPTFLSEAIPKSIRSLLQAIDRRDDELIWQQYSLIPIIERQLLTRAHLCEVLLSMRPRRYLPISWRLSVPSWKPACESLIQYSGGTGQIETWISPKESPHPSHLAKKRLVREKFIKRVLTVVQDIRDQGHWLGAIEYAHLLDCARAAENVQLAHDIWAEMDRLGVKRDSKCYNSYLGALCGVTLTEATWKINSRTVETRLRNKGNTSALALKIYNKMINEGYSPNTMTIDLVLLAAGRMRSVTMVKSVLHRAWGIEMEGDSFIVPSLEEPLEGELQPNASQTPLNIKPSEHTLSNIAICLSQLGEVSTAIRLVDYLSRKYKVEITTPTWQQLLTWTYVFSRPPARSRILPSTAVESLWKIMRSEPYNISPNMEMYDHIIRHYISVDKHHIARDLLDEALLMMPKLQKSVDKHYKRLNKTLLLEQEKENEQEELYLRKETNVTEEHEEQEAQMKLTSQNARSIHDLYARLAHKTYLLERAHSLASRWIELLVLGKSICRRSWFQVQVPRLIEKYGEEYLGDIVHYHTISGWVELELRKTDPAISGREPEQRIFTSGKDVSKRVKEKLRKMRALSDNGPWLWHIRRTRQRARWRWMNGRGRAYGVEQLSFNEREAIA